MNECTSCGQVFASISAFDKHRIGKHDYLYSPERPDGRRCRAPAELGVLGMHKDSRQRWRLESRGAPSWQGDVAALTVTRPDDNK
jgi:hypothetical protein